MTPEERRDVAIGLIEAAGGIVDDTTPLAVVSDPHRVVAYRVAASATDETILAALHEIREDTEYELRGMIPWTPEVVVSDDGS